MSSSHNNAGRDEGSTTDIQVLAVLLLKHSTHVGPLAKLGVSHIRVILDTDTDTVLIAGTTPGLVRSGLLSGCGSGCGGPSSDGRCEVGMSAAHLQVSRALGVLGVKFNGRGTKPAPNVDEARPSVPDDFSKLITEVIGHTLEALWLVITALS